MLSRRLKIMIRIRNNVVVDKDGCWIWQGAHSGVKKNDLNSRGHSYGRISIKGRTSAVHRVSYVTKYGYIPNRVQVDHLCGKRKCCNPRHLDAVSQSKNMKMIGKERKPKRSLRDMYRIF